MLLRSEPIVFLWHTYKRIHGFCLWQSAIRTPLQTNKQTTKQFWKSPCDIGSFVLVKWLHIKLLSVLRKTVPEVSLLFPLFLQSSFMFFFKLLLLMFIFISHLVFYGLFLSTCWCCVFSFVRLFFSRISSFFSPHSASQLIFFQ